MELTEFDRIINDGVSFADSLFSEIGTVTQENRLEFQRKMITHVDLNALRTQVDEIPSKRKERQMRVIALISEGKTLENSIIGRSYIKRRQTDVHEEASENYVD